MIDQDLIEFLKGLATAAGNRVYLGNAPQGAQLPVIVIRRTGGITPTTQSGLRLFERSQFAVHVLTNEYATAYPVANAVKDALAGTRSVPAFVGQMGSTPIKTTRLIRSPSDESEIDGDKVIRWVAMEFLFMHA
jgi:hypothetical protein